MEWSSKCLNGLVRFLHVWKTLPTVKNGHVNIGKTAFVNIPFPWSIWVCTWYIPGTWNSHKWCFDRMIPNHDKWNMCGFTISIHLKVAWSLELFSGDLTQTPFWVGFKHGFLTKRAKHLPQVLDRDRFTKFLWIHLLGFVFSGDFLRIASWDASVFKPPLDGGFKYFLFSPLFGEDSHFD